MCGQLWQTLLYWLHLESDGLTSCFFFSDVKCSGMSRNVSYDERYQRLVEANLNSMVPSEKCIFT